MPIHIDLDGDKNNNGADLTNKLIEKEKERINNGLNMAKIWFKVDPLVKTVFSES